MQERFSYLFNRYADKKHTPAEKQELMEMIDSGEYEADLNRLVAERWDMSLPAYEMGEARAGELFDKILNSVKVKRVNWWLRAAAAAIIIGMLGGGGYFLFFNKSTSKLSDGAMARHIKNDVAPGGNKAILTLSNGTQIILNSTANGTITQQGNTKIIKLDSGQLAYQPVTLSEAKGLNGEVTYNTISTPNGGQYQIVLADGSKIWLNAASSLKYPTAFTGKERNVELTGEGYFEVAHDASKPFKVSVNGMEVQVLGTHFNINAYDDEDVIKTTLLEGSVKVSLPSPSGEGSGVRLKPGQQAILPHVTLSAAKGLNDSKDVPASQFKVVAADLDQAIAWKNGMFNFKSADIKTIMRQVSKWYDVEVVYEGTVPSGHYNGKTSRNLDASQMLKVLEESGVKFSIEGKKITVKE